ncbi:MAG: hypothetical protein LBQ98_07435 [Nitrososphaerota archaeon]|jgi:hypothetical protein|nr:hypothetical protein [Nitrososphaerota archaeon]
MVFVCVVVGSGWVWSLGCLGGDVVLVDKFKGEIILGKDTSRYVQTFICVLNIFYCMLKGAIAPILAGCGILLLNPHLMLYFEQIHVNGYFIVVLSVALVLTALIYTAVYIDNLWGKKEYRVVKKSICLMILSIVLCPIISVLSVMLFPIKVVAFILLIFSI